MGVNTGQGLYPEQDAQYGEGAAAVHSLRAQADKQRYHEEMKKTIERQENLDMKQAEVVDLIVEDGKVRGVVTRTGGIYRAEAVILATGTFLRGKIFIGESSYDSGPNGMAPSMELSDSLKKYGIFLRRFKTGTPARVDGKTLDYDEMTVQHGDDRIVPFSFMNELLDENRADCWLSYTNEETHEIIRNNFHRSALFTGEIEGVGPRYCPSIETKIDRFADKKRHQLFVEPEGLGTDEMYIQGMSSSLPEDVQEAFYHTIPGLRHCKIVRPAYAIEYDCIDSLDLKTTLESRVIGNLYFAGQTNGSSGYEEAAAQGLMAGINAALKVQGKDPFILDRSEAYIGVLIDDLVTKGTQEPYRIMTSRVEYRLLLRQDNAAERLTEKGYRIGLVSEERYRRYLSLKEETEKEMERLRSTYVTPSEADDFLLSVGSSPLQNRISLAELLKRPQVTYENMRAVDPDRPSLSYHSMLQAYVNIKYEGYISKQLAQIEKFRKLESQLLPEDIDYAHMDGIRLEARQKLNDFRPDSVGQASRISGVSPADINVLLIHLEKRRREQAKEREAERGADRERDDKPARDHKKSERNGQEG